MPVWAPDDARPGTGRCFMSQTATGEKRRVFAEEHIFYCIYIDISLLTTKNINTKIYISLEQLKMINMQRKSAIESYAFLSKYGFHHHHCQSKSQYFLILTTCFFRGIITTSNEFTIAPENSSKIGRPPYGVRLITYNAVRCPAGHRLMFSYTDAGRRPYDL